MVSERTSMSAGHRSKGDGSEDKLVSLPRAPLLLALGEGEGEER